MIMVINSTFISSGRKNEITNQATEIQKIPTINFEEIVVLVFFLRISCNLPIPEIMTKNRIEVKKIYSIN